MLRPILLVQAALVLFATVNAVPVGLVARQQVAETQLQTVQTTQTNQGLMTQTCTITLTPITVNGNPAVQEVQSCTVSMGGTGENSGNPSAPSSTTNTNPESNSGNSGGGGGQAGAVNSVTSVPDSFTQTFSAETGSETSAPSGSSGTTTSAASTTSSSAASNGEAGVVNPVESVAASALSSDLVAATAATATATGITAGATVAAANAAVSTTAAAQAFALPGKKLQVLPIGLGVFAGISVIALIVVGLVTYERTKYRKAFRQRKLAEAGSAMGYGGMAQRT